MKIEFNLQPNEPHKAQFYIAQSKEPLTRRESAAPKAKPKPFKLYKRDWYAELPPLSTERLSEKQVR